MSSRGPTLQNMVPRAILAAENSGSAAAFERRGRRKPSPTAQRTHAETQRVRRDLLAYQTRQRFYDIGTPDRLLAIQDLFAS